MKVKKAHTIRLYLLLWLLTVALTLLAGIAMPKYAVRLWFFEVFITLELLLWFNFNKYLQYKNPGFAKSLRILYWLPLLLLGVFVVGISLLPVDEWPHVVRIYFPAFLMIMYVGKVLFGIMLLVAGIIYLFNKLLKKKLLTSVWKSAITVGLILWATIVVLMVSGMIFGIRNVKVREQALLFSELPEQFDGYRIVQISDLHLGSYLNKKPLEKIVKQINALDADLVFFTGDLVNDQTSEAFPYKDQLASIKARDGIFCILGNHDYGDYKNWNDSISKALNNQALATLYSDLGWQLLNNHNETLKKGTDSIAIIGVENWSFHKVFGRKGDLKKAYAGTEKIPFKILLTHDPSHWKAEVLKQFDDVALTLSGHTHAMQMGIETSWLKWSPSVWLFREWGGLYSQQNSNGLTQYLYVNSGTGQLGYPGRVGIPPEITLIVLNKK